MSPETQAFLDQVRDAEDPPPEVEERVLLALNATVAAGALSAGAWSASKLFKLLASSGISAWKLGLGTLGLGLLAGTSALVWPREADREARPPLPVAHARASVAPPRPAPTPASEAAPPPTTQEPSKRRPRPARAAARAPARAPSLRDELSLLAQVQSALQRGEGDEALRLLDEHHTSDRQLLAERAAARVFSLCAAGRIDEARHAAAAFARAHPGSLQISAVARSCAGKEQP